MMREARDELDGIVRAPWENGGGDTRATRRFHVGIEEEGEI